MNPLEELSKINKKHLSWKDSLSVNVRGWSIRLLREATPIICERQENALEKLSYIANEAFKQFSLLMTDPITRSAYHQPVLDNSGPWEASLHPLFFQKYGGINPLNDKEMDPFPAPHFFAIETRSWVKTHLKALLPQEKAKETSQALLAHIDLSRFYPPASEPCDALMCPYEEAVFLAQEYEKLHQGKQLQRARQQQWLEESREASQRSFEKREQECEEFFEVISEAISEATEKTKQSLKDLEARLDQSRREFLAEISAVEQKILALNQSECERRKELLATMQAVLSKHAAEMGEVERSLNSIQATFREKSSAIEGPLSKIQGENCSLWLKNQNLQQSSRQIQSTLDQLQAVDDEQTKEIRNLQTRSADNDNRILYLHRRLQELW
jgi:hypothetical protein